MQRARLSEAMVLPAPRYVIFYNFIELVGGRGGVALLCYTLKIRSF